MLNEDSKDSDMEYHSMYLQNIVITFYACLLHSYLYYQRDVSEKKHGCPVISFRCVLQRRLFGFFV